MTTTKPIRLFLDSDLAISGTPSSAIFQIKNIKVKGFKVVSFNMFNTIYNVNSNNNTLVFTLNNVDYYVNLNIGFYTTDILYQNIQQSINSQIPGAAVTVTYDPLTAHYQISGFSSQAKFQSSLSTAGRLLGFDGDQLGTTLISNVIANINPLDYFYLTSSALSQLTQVIVPNIDFTNVILKIVIDNSTGFLVEYDNFSSDRFVADNAISLSNIDIGIVDKYFKPIPNQEKWSMELSLDLVVNQTISSTISTMPTTTNYPISTNYVYTNQTESSQNTNYNYSGGSMNNLAYR